VRVVVAVVVLLALLLILQEILKTVLGLAVLGAGLTEQPHPMRVGPLAETEISLSLEMALTGRSAAAQEVVAVVV
jgi:hypothetical protein